VLLSCKGRAGLVVNVTTIIPQTDKAFRVSLAIKLRVLDRLLNIDARLSWIVNCAHLTLCAAARHFKSSCDGALWGRGDPQNGSGASTVLSDRQNALSLLSNHRETLVPRPRVCFWLTKSGAARRSTKAIAGLRENLFLGYFGPCRGFTSAVPSGLSLEMKALLHALS
jgi:hypothetical protein